MPVRVIIVADTVVRISWASLAEPWNASLSSSEPGLTWIPDSNAPAPRPSTIPSPGKTQTAPCR